jgi:hypothetical protein
MRVVCINNGNNDYLTIGKTYEGTDLDQHYQIRDDSGDLWNYHAHRFIPEQHIIRDNKLKQLIDEAVSN